MNLKKWGGGVFKSQTAYSNFKREIFLDIFLSITLKLLANFTVNMTVNK